MNIALILAGGKGSRMNLDTPKQYLKAGGKMIIEYSISVFLNNSLIDELYIAAEEGFRPGISDAAVTASDKFKGFTNPGATRQLSIYNSLKYIKESTGGRKGDRIMIHDAARPVLSDTLIGRCFDAMIKTRADAVLPVLPVKDTLYYCENKDTVSGLLDRDKIYAGQAPELFDFDKYYDANLMLYPDSILSIRGSAEAAYMAGMKVSTVYGDENNFKITTMEDLERFRRML